MKELAVLQQLSRLYGLQTAYYDVDDELCHARPESLQRILQLLGVPLERVADAAAACRERRLSLWRRMMEPVAVAWDGRLAVPLRRPSDCVSGAYQCRILLEQGGGESFAGRLENLPREKQRTVEGTPYLVLRLTVPHQLPAGYHRLVLETDSETAECLVLSTPIKAFTREKGESRRRWGVFVPLYALHSERSWGGGDFSDLERMVQWVSDQGGGLVATLPLLAWLPEVSDDPSPYSPASRLFWNEFYLDVTRIPELRECRAAQEILASDATQRTLNELRSDPHVDYVRQMQLKRNVLMPLAASCFAGESTRRTELEAFRRRHPELETYARFRAVGERQGCTWPLWPARLRGGDIRDGDYDRTIFEYHLYTQWQVEQQLESLAEEARANGMLWYLDFPLGVAGAGYDVWRYGDVFASGASGGAPPDAFFTKGQNWGFPPLSPDGLRRQEYRYFIQSLRRHLQYARLLRIDHVMSLHRMYWIPDGFDARDGVYVHHRTEELFALLVLESHRHQAEIVGENLGTVPPAVDHALVRHHIRDMYVVQYEAKPDRIPPLREVPELSVASLNTHDMPTFAAFWTALDVDDRLDLELLNVEEAGVERERRVKTRLALATFLCERGLLNEGSLDPRDVLPAFLCWLRSTPANVVLVNLEDLWEETQPQNTPGTFRERCNWRRKLRFEFETFRELPQVVETLAAVNEQRTKALP